MLKEQHENAEGFVVVDGDAIDALLLEFLNKTLSEQ